MSLESNPGIIQMYAKHVREVHHDWTPISDMDWGYICTLLNFPPQQQSSDEVRAHYFVASNGEVVRVSDIKNENDIYHIYGYSVGIKKGRTDD